MEIIIHAEAREFAALVLELQKQQENTDYVNKTSRALGTSRESVKTTDDLAQQSAASALPAASY